MWRHALGPDRWPFLDGIRRQVAGSPVRRSVRCDLRHLPGCITWSRQAGAQEGLGQIGRHRAGQVVTLDDVALRMQQELPLRLPFHPFGNNLHVELVRH